jgi:uncharacterized membrane protein
MNTLEIITLLVAGWVAGAESGSWACVHPVIKKLPSDYQIIFQQGLLKTFGRVMPVLMTLNLVLVILLWVRSSNEPNAIYSLRLIAMGCLIAMIITTVFFNVPVNQITGTWDPEDLPANWKRKRAQWRFFQGFRSIMLIAAFVLLVIAQTIK